MLKIFSSWRYFLCNYERGFVAPNAGSHGLLVLNHMQIIYNNKEYKNKYPDIITDLKACEKIKERYLNNNYYLKKSDTLLLKQTADKIYDSSPLLFRYSIKLNEWYIDKKNSMGIQHDEYKGDTTLLENLLEKNFK